MEISDILKIDKNTYNFSGPDSVYSTGRAGKFDRLLQKNLSDDTKSDNIKINDRIKNRPLDKKLMDTCIEMESIFVSRMLREMRDTVPEERLIYKGYAEKVFEDMLYDEYALNLSKTSNLGIASMLYDELSNK